MGGASFWLMATIVAHTVDIDRAAGIAGTWHIDPSHNPRVNEPARVWVVVTERGGKQIPIANLKCKLEVYRQNRLLQTLMVKPTDAERYRQIPSAEVIFPQRGQYRLQLNCAAPRPFVLTYETIVR